MEEQDISRQRSRSVTFREDDTSDRSLSQDRSLVGSEATRERSSSSLGFGTRSRSGSRTLQIPERERSGGRDRTSS